MKNCYYDRVTENHLSLGGEESLRSSGYERSFGKRETRSSFRGLTDDETSPRGTEEGRWGLENRWDHPRCVSGDPETSPEPLKFLISL